MVDRRTGEGGREVAQVEVTGDRDNLWSHGQVVRCGLDLPARSGREIGGVVVGRGNDAGYVAEAPQESRRGLLTDARHPGQPVGGVTAQRREVGVLCGVDAVLVPHDLVRHDLVPPDAASDIEHPHAGLVVDELEKVTVAGDDIDRHTSAGGECAEYVVGLISVGADHADAQRGKYVENDRHLLLQGVGHFLDIGFVGRSRVLDAVRLVRRDQRDAPGRTPVVVPGTDEIGRLVLRDESRDEVEQSAHRIHVGAVGARRLGDTEEGSEVHRCGVEHQHPSLVRAGGGGYGRVGRYRHVGILTRLAVGRTPHRHRGGAANVTRVEETDRLIVRLLGEDGRMSFTDLGKATGLSTSAVHQRVKRLEQRGLIQGYGARVDHDQLGRPLTAFVSITPFDTSAPDDYPDLLANISAIESCWSVAGDESYILKVRVGTPGELEDLLARIRSAANVSTRTTIVLSTPYENRPATD